MAIENEALWLESPGGQLHTAPAPRTSPGPTEVIVRTRALAVNPVDTMNGVQRRMIYPWLAYPAVLGTDVAGEVVEAGSGIDHVRVGDRVAGLAMGQDQQCNSSARGAFQRYVALPGNLTSPIPDHVTYQEAVVLPLAVATASAGLFGKDQLALQLPGSGGVDRDQTVLVWGGSTSVGCNAIQLARHAGYRVVATASPHNHAMLHDLGAAAVVDYRDRAAVNIVVDALKGHRMAGAVAIGTNSLTRIVRIIAALQHHSGSHAPVRVSSAHPSPITTMTSIFARLRGVHVSAIWAGTVAHDRVGETVFTEILPAALASGSYLPAPVSEVVGQGLEAVPEAMKRLRAGVSARKLVVTMST